MSMQSFYEWIDTTAVSQYLQNSTLWFPITEVFHLIGLTILLGVVFVVCIRLFGFGLQQPASQTHGGLWGWTWLGLVVVFGTGVILLIAEPIKLASNEAFYYKLWFLGAGVALHLFGYLAFLKPGRVEASPVLSRVVAILTLCCWFGAGIAGRAIGFV